MDVEKKADAGVTLARGLLLAVVVSMLVSTSIAIGFEFAAYIVFAVLAEPRRRLMATLRHPLMIGFLVFAAPIVVATFYGAAAWHDSLTALFGWRRALLLPLALAVFDDRGAKRLVLETLLVVCVVGALASLASVASAIAIKGYAPGIVFRNYATQGMVMTVALVVAVAAIMRPDLFVGSRVLARRAVMAAVACMLVVDIVFVLPGRSGYVTILLMVAAVVTLLIRGTWRLKLGALVAILVVIGGLLASSPLTRSRIAQGFDEIAAVDRAEQGSSFGLRTVFWRNTVRMVADHPVFGVGTGGFPAGYLAYVRDVPGWHGTQTGDPHNQFLKFMAEQGAIGLAAVLFFIVSAFRVRADTPYRELAAAVLIGWCATSIANAHFSTFVEGRMLFFWLGAMLAGRAANAPAA